MNRWAVPFLGALAGTCMADANITTTALVDAARSLSMPPSWLPIAASLMSTCLAATVVSVGLLADRMGRRRLLVLAMIVGITAEALTAASPAGVVFLAGRALTGVAMGGVFSAAFATVRDVAAPGRQGAAMGVFGAASGLALLVVSFVGGGMATIEWRLAYLVVPAVFLACLVAVPRLVPSVPPIGEGPLDVLGQVLLALAVVAPLIGLGQATRSLTSPAVWVPVLLGVAAFAAFYGVERRRGNAFYPVRLFTEPLFIGAVLVGIGFNLSQSVLLLQLSDVLQYVHGFSTIEVSLAQFPALGCGVLAAVAAGRLVSGGVAVRAVAAAGSGAVVADYLSLLAYGVGSSFWVLVPALVLIGAGAQTLAVPFGHLIVKAAPPKQYGPVTFSRLTVGQLTFAVGMAGSTVLIDRLTTGGIVARLEAAGAQPPGVRDDLEAVSLYVQGNDPGVTRSVRDALSVAADSYVSAFTIMAAVMALILAVTGFAAWLVLRRSSVAAPVPGR